MCGNVEKFIPLNLAEMYYISPRLSIVVNRRNERDPSEDLYSIVVKKIVLSTIRNRIYNVLG
jgi:hypothetical protein